MRLVSFFVNILFIAFNLFLGRAFASEPEPEPEPEHHDATALADAGHTSHTTSTVEHQGVKVEGLVGIVGNNVFHSVPDMPPHYVLSPLVGIQVEGTNRLGLTVEGRLGVIFSPWQHLNDKHGAPLPGVYSLLGFLKEGRWLVELDTTVEFDIRHHEESDERRVFSTADGALVAGYPHRWFTIAAGIGVFPHDHHGNLAVGPNLLLEMNLPEAASGKCSVWAQGTFGWTTVPEDENYAGFLFAGFACAVHKPHKHS